VSHDAEPGWCVCDRTSCVYAASAGSQTADQQTRFVSCRKRYCDIATTAACRQLGHLASLSHAAAGCVSTATWALILHLSTASVWQATPTTRKRTPVRVSDLPCIATAACIWFNWVLLQLLLCCKCKAQFCWLDMISFSTTISAAWCCCHNQASMCCNRQAVVLYMCTGSHGLNPLSKTSAHALPLAQHGTNPAHSTLTTPSFHPHQTSLPRIPQTPPQLCTPAA